MKLTPATKKLIDRLKSEAAENENGAAPIASKEVAQIIRNVLKETFPGVNFSVKSDHNSVDVYWEDGPAESAVNAILGQYTFGGFDGSIDLAYSSTNWLLPDGSMLPCESAGTVGSRGCHEGYVTDQPVAGAFIVKYGPKYVHAHQRRSDAYCRRLAEAVEQKYGIEVNHSRPYWDQYHEGESISTLMFQLQD